MCLLSDSEEEEYEEEEMADTRGRGVPLGGGQPEKKSQQSMLDALRCPEGGKDKSKGKKGQRGRSEELV